MVRESFAGVLCRRRVIADRVRSYTCFIVPGFAGRVRSCISTYGCLLRTVSAINAYFSNG